MGYYCLAVLSICLVSQEILATPLVIPLNRDKLYLPDQVDYLKAWSVLCESDNLILWPKDGRCYPESSQGPCFVQEVLLFDRRRLLPLCVPEPAEGDNATPTQTLLPPGTALDN